MCNSPVLEIIVKQLIKMYKSTAIKGCVGYFHNYNVLLIGYAPVLKTSTYLNMTKTYQSLK